MKPDGGTAFPALVTTSEWNENAATYIDHLSPMGGMTLRDWFAGQALAGLATLAGNVPEAKKFAEDAYLLADCMLKARESKAEAP